MNRAMVVVLIALCALLIWMLYLCKPPSVRIQLNDIGHFDNSLRSYGAVSAPTIRKIKLTIYYPTGKPTASGKRLWPGVHAAVSPALERHLPLGSKIRVPGRPSLAKDGLWRVEDRTDQELPGLVLDLSQPRRAKQFTDYVQLAIKERDSGLVR